MIFNSIPFETKLTATEVGLVFAFHLSREPSALTGSQCVNSAYGSMFSVLM